jgi:predicted anti-sigma-YlaC factor YlaD
MADCRNYRRLLSLEMDGEIETADGRLLQDHLEACPACREEKRLWLRVRDLTPMVPPVEADGLVARALARIRDRRREANRAVIHLRRTAAAAALLLLASVAVLLALPDPVPRRTLALGASEDLGRVLEMKRTKERALTLSADDGGTPR